MVSIRRKLGAFVAAVAIAAAMVAVPTTAHAKQKTGSLDGFCAQLLSAIKYLETLSPNVATELTLASLEATYGVYCQ
jgi:hypothetical protein